MTYLQMQKISRKRFSVVSLKFNWFTYPYLFQKQNKTFGCIFFYFKGFIELYLQCSAFLKRIIYKDSYKNIKRNFDKYYQNFQLVI